MTADKLQRIAANIALSIRCGLCAFLLCAWPIMILEGGWDWALLSLLFGIGICPAWDKHQ